MTELAKFEAGSSMAIRAPLWRAWAKYAEPIALIVLCELTAATFLLSAIAKSTSDYYWIDEILAVWAAQLHTPSEIVTAIWKGAEFSPPTYDIFLHFVLNTFGSSRLIARLPSIISILLSAIVFASLVWRRLGALSAALTFGLVVNSFLFEFAIQARPYALLVAVVSLAVLVWSMRKAENASWWQATALGFLLFACISIHFYALVIVAAFALLELLWSVSIRRIRPQIWCGFAAAAVASVVWLPLMLHLSKYNSGDTSASEFYGATTLSHLARDIFTLLVGSGAFVLFIFAALLVIGAAYVGSAIRRRPQPEPARVSSMGTQETQIALIGFALFATLPLAFALALGVTHVLTARYALPASLGAILLFVLALRKVPYHRTVSLLLLAVLCVLPLFREPPRDLAAEGLEVLRHAPSEGPIVVADNNLYVDLMGAAEPPLRSRLVFLTSPAGVVAGDTATEHQIVRLFESFRPDLAVKDASSFIADHPRFLALGRPGRATDGLSPWFIAKGWVRGFLSLHNDAALLEIDTGSSHPAH